MDRKPLILAIETASGCGSAALTEGDWRTGVLLAEVTCQPRAPHSRRLLGSVEWLMQESGLGWSDLDGVAVSLGPGSFTGLRIGLAAAKGIAMAAELPLLGIPTLDALALSVPNPGRPLCCLLDARRQEVYASWYGVDSWPSAEGQAQAIAPGKLAQSIRSPVLLAGPGAEVYAEVFSTNPHIELVPAALSFPRAALVGFLGAAMSLRGEKTGAVELTPLYIRVSEAEITLGLKNREP